MRYEANITACLLPRTTQQNAALVEEAAASGRAIVDQIRALDNLISRYELGSNANRDEAPPRGEMRAPSKAMPRGVTPARAEDPGRKAA